MARRAAPAEILIPVLRSFVAALLLVLAGCAKTDPMDAMIAAGDTTTFVRWKRDVVADFPPAVQQQFETVLQELRIDIQFKREVSGHDAIEAEVCKRLDQHSVKEALLMGLELKWHRLTAERGDMQRVIDANERIITKPGDEAAAAEVAEYRAKHQARADAAGLELKAVERDLVALGGKIPAIVEAPPPSQRIAMSHNEARQQVAELIDGRRNAATARYGRWPVKIDWGGAELTEDKRAEFLAKKTADAREGKIIVPIRIKKIWLLFEGLDQAPALPTDVKSQLTPAELTAFKKDWLEVEAEIWARQVGKDLPDPPAEPVEEKPDEMPVLLHNERPVSPHK